MTLHKIFRVCISETLNLSLEKCGGKSYRAGRAGKAIGPLKKGPTWLGWLSLCLEKPAWSAAQCDRVIRWVPLSMGPHRITSMAGVLV